jgi:DNA mismatch repair protein MutS
MPPWYFDVESARRTLMQQFGVQDLSGLFGCDDLPLAVAAAGCLVQYARDTQRAALPHLQVPKIVHLKDHLILDATSQRNLEIHTSLSGQRDHSLAGVMDTTETPMGSRMLRRWLQAPLRDRDQLRQRQHCVGAILRSSLIEELQQRLRSVGDMERILARVALKSARPRDLSRLRTSLATLPSLQELLAVIESPLIDKLSKQIGEFPELRSLLVQAIAENPPVLVRDGGVIAPGYDKELDKLRQVNQDAGKTLVEFERRERDRTQLGTLRIGFNRVHGYYIEVSRNQSELVPPGYRRRQTLKGNERFITEELQAVEARVLSAGERALAREKCLYSDLLDRLSKQLPPLQGCSAALAELDVLTAFAERAASLDLNPPQLTDVPGIRIEAGRHLVVEALQEAPFMPNDLVLDDSRRMLIITGPNMGGKSTYMRQTALIVILASSGSFVPAETAIVGPIDRIFTRIGAADDLASGRSTFMVEMTETANILNNATANSLVLLDEVGRGTSTFDGLSLAWASALHLLRETCAFTLFATHYFEMTALPEEYEGAKNVHLDAIEHHKKVVFLHKVKEGSASQSYGLQVASLAGVPGTVIDQARERLKRLENGRSTRYHGVRERPTQPVGNPEWLVMTQLLKSIDPDEMSPKQALDTLYQIKSLLH